MFYSVFCKMASGFLLGKKDKEKQRKKRRQTICVLSPGDEGQAGCYNGMLCSAQQGLTGTLEATEIQY